MSSLCDTFENDLAKLIFNGVAIANIADNASSSPATSFYWRLHTADPGESGAGTANEATYTSYAAVAAARNSGGLSVSGSVVTNAVDVTFPKATGGSLPQSITHISLNTASTGAGKILCRGALATAIPVGLNVQPKFLAGDLTVVWD